MIIARLNVILFLCTTVTLVGCSSAPPAVEVHDEEEASVQVKPQESKTEKKDQSVLEKQKDEKSSVTSGQLVDAIKSGSDENVHRTASLLLSQNNQDVMALNAMGLYHYRKSQPLAAQMMFLKALKIQPKNSDLYTNLGLTYFQLNQTKEAVQSFKKAIELNPQDQNAAANLGSYYLQQKDYPKAFLVMDIADLKNSKDVKVLTNFAIASAANGKEELAENLYQSALKLSANNKDVLYNLAVFQINYQRKMKDGIETLDRIKILGPVDSMKKQINVLENRAKTGLK